MRAWEDWRVEAEQYRQLDDERALVLARRHARGKRSGVTVEQIDAKATNVVHVRDGRVTRLVLYTDRDRALADLGRAPEADTPRKRVEREDPGRRR